MLNKLLAAALAVSLLAVALPVAAHEPTGGVPGEVGADTPSPDGADCFEVYEMDGEGGWQLSTTTIPRIIEVRADAYTNGYTADHPGYTAEFNRVWGGHVGNPANTPGATLAQQSAGIAAARAAAETKGDEAADAAVNGILKGAHAHRVECEDDTGSGNDDAARGGGPYGIYVDGKYHYCQTRISGDRDGGRYRDCQTRVGDLGMQDVSGSVIGTTSPSG